MRILFVSHAPLEKELGASKVLIELAEEMGQLGWECHLESVTHLVPRPIEGGSEIYARALRQYLLDNANEFDVIDYDHVYLPYPRISFSPKTLFVARSVLLAHHSLDIKPKTSGNWKSRLRSIVLAPRLRSRRNEIVSRAQITIAESDLVNVANRADETTLLRTGIPSEKIVVIPYGLSRERRRLFDEVSTMPPAGAKIAFVGTFDNRKGATDFPQIVRDVVASVPECSFLLLGTYKKGPEVLAAFPVPLRDKIEVVPRYLPESLPGLLASCTVGVFPSYVEGFGFGILEMLAAGIPVIAYDVPGPPMMLPPRYLVAAGDTAAMGRKVVELLRNREDLVTARAWAQRRSRDFSWSIIARQTSEIYSQRWQQKQGGTPLS